MKPLQSTDYFLGACPSSATNVRSINLIEMATAKTRRRYSTLATVPHAVEDNRISDDNESTAVNPHSRSDTEQSKDLRPETLAMPCHSIPMVLVPRAPMASISLVSWDGGGVRWCCQQCSGDLACFAGLDPRIHSGPTVW